MTSSIGEHGQVVGADLADTNVERLPQAIVHQGCIALLLKINQIGINTKAIDAVKLSCFAMT